jgi:hypothetical protein
MPRTKNPLTDPTGEKAAAKAAKEVDKRARAKVKDRLMGAGDKAQRLAEGLGTALQATTSTVNNVASGVSAVANAVTGTAANITNAANNVRQALAPGQGSQRDYASSNLQHSGDIYGGLAMPAVDFTGMVPTDLLNPSGLPECSEDQLTHGLAVYASATRAMELYKAGFQYIEKIGQTKQQFHKAQSSVIKAATEQVKVHQEVVRFDRQNVELDIDREKLEQTNEKLKQAQITTLATRNETVQLIQKIEANEGKKDAEIRSIQAQTQDIIQRYLKDSIANGT